MSRRVLSTFFLSSMLAMLVACADDSDVEESEGDDGEADEEETEESADADEEAEEGGDFHLARGEDATSLDPHLYTDIASMSVAFNFYETLVERDENMEIQPLLAEDYEQIDENTWEFNLREDVEFHDGEPFNAEAVEVNLERLFDEDIAAPRADYLEAISDVEAIDEYTVEITTDEPFAPLLGHLAHNVGSMISPAAIEADANDDHNLEIEPVGTGPFEFAEWEQGDEIVLERNDDYWGDNAYLDSVTFEVVPEISTRLSMLENNETDAVETVEPANAPRVEGMDNAELFASDSFLMMYLGMQTENEPLDDPDVRRAITLAIDNDTIIDGIYEGYAEPANGPINDLVFGHDPDAEPTPYDPEEAEQLLADAGYEDGVTIELQTSDTNEVSIQISEVIQDMLGDVGIDVELEQMEWGAYMDYLEEGEQGMYIMSWSAITVDADATMMSLFHSDSHGAAGNRMFYENEEMDQVLEEARAEIDEDEREQLYHDAYDILSEDTPMHYIAFQQQIEAVGDHVEGFDRWANSRYIFEDVYFTEETDSGGY
ncbi:glutathione ABC transporter substrate-binding protein [Natribacillus halophilus]|uniref:Peptide/nickel transport system substrate-binding protein n=1 Tax=Natribacillus halophilus TaxID=549003 RepID=A0A1G8SQ22_9BACI|nr:glutathione ABC transporter substrate-binding protein [Natribacillus halophilus]SDJ31274.1 peptide/nickel transport system substrate-binding protein [Natribacillus halophilus]